MNDKFRRNLFLQLSTYISNNSQTIRKMIDFKKKYFLTCNEFYLRKVKTINLINPQLKSHYPQ